MDTARHFSQTYAEARRQFLGRGRDGQAARQEGGPVGDEGTRFVGGGDLHRSALS